MAEKMAKHRERYRAKYANTRLVEYKINDEVLCFDPKMKSFCINKKIYSIQIIPLLESETVLSLSHIDLQYISEHSASFYLSH